MENLYGRLFKYRTREKRAPLEDYLSEALVDLLKRMPASAVREFISLIVNEKSSEAGPLAQLLADEPTLTWTTQRRIEQPNRGIIDILLEIDGLPAIIIENKISSSLRRHTSDVDGGLVNRNQLSTYGFWLTGKADKAWGGALVLLTHTTSAPPDFLDPSAAHYGVPHRNIVMWSALARWFGQAVEQRSKPPTPDAWVQLAGDYVAFLKEQEMTTETVSASDLAALQLHLPTADRLSNTFDRAWASTAQIRDRICSNRYSKLKYDADGGLVWSWSYTKQPPAPPSSYLAIGIRFPEQSDWWEGAALPRHPHVFLMIGDDNGQLPVELVSSLPQSWSQIEQELVAAIPISELDAGVGGLADGFAEWVSAKMAEAVPMIEALSKT